MKTILAILILAVSAAAQSAKPLTLFPAAPSTTKFAATRWEKKPPNVYLSPFKDPSFYLATGNFAASAVYDVHKTKVCEANLTCVEAYKGHDHYGYVVPQIAIVAGANYGCSLMLHDHKWLKTFLCPLPSVAWSAVHWHDATHIYRNDLVARP